MFGDRENEGNVRKKVRHSASLRSFGLVRKPVTVAISQPVLDDTSREKLRNKVKHSPSMLSIHNGHSELHTTQHRRLVAELLRNCAAGRIEQPNEVPLMHEFPIITKLSHTYANHLLHSLYIHDILSINNTNGFARFSEVHLVEEDGDILCAMKFDDAGQPLDKLEFSTEEATVNILMNVARILSEAEDSCQFEHRNLHAGNILVKSLEGGEIGKVTLINCDLGRLVDPLTGKVYSTPLDRSEFYQPMLPVLDLMRQKVKSADTYAPTTNVLWLLYLARYLQARVTSSAMKRAVEVLSPSWGNLRKGPKSAREAHARLLKRL